MKIDQQSFQRGWAQKTSSYISIGFDSRLYERLGDGVNKPAPGVEKRLFPGRRRQEDGRDREPAHPVKRAIEVRPGTRGKTALFVLNILSWNARPHARAARPQQAIFLSCSSARHRCFPNAGEKSTDRRCRGPCNSVSIKTRPP